MKLNECYSIPNHFVKELTDYDPLLRIRWAKGEGLVRLERKVRHAHKVHLVGDGEVDEATAARLFDDVQTMNDGYALVTKFEPKASNWPKILYTIALTDLQRLGGARKIADNMENAEEFDKARRQWNRRDDFRHMATDLYRHMNTIKTCPEGAGHKAYGGF